jgi:hypothetical protein
MPAKASHHIQHAQAAAAALYEATAAAAAALAGAGSGSGGGGGDGRKVGGGAAEWPAPAGAVAPRRLTLSGGLVAAVERLSAAPPLFLVHGLLSPAECAAIVAAARGALRPSGTFADGGGGGGARRRSRTAWLPLHGPGAAGTVARRVQALLGLPAAALMASERMQVAP